MSKRSRKDGRRKGRKAGTREVPESDVSIPEAVEVEEPDVIDVEIVDLGNPGVTIVGVDEARKRPVRRKRRRPPGGKARRREARRRPTGQQRTRARRPSQRDDKPFMSISLIAAVAQNDVIGRDGTIPWDLPRDREFFKRVTKGHAVIMGRKTFENIGVLEGRRNIVLSRNEDYVAEGATVVHDVVDALIIGGATGGEVFVAGGGEVYEEFLPLAEKIYITRIQGGFSGDTRFPRIFPGDWNRVDSRPGKRDSRNKLFYRFEIYER